LGENLAAQHYVKQSGVDVEEFAQRFLDEWMKSQPHRENLAFADYDRTGVGAAVNGDTVYVAQLFASNLGGTAGRDPKSGATEFPSAEAARKADSSATATPPLRLRGAESGPSN
jgi:Cysteine-rich secretory protein family